MTIANQPSSKTVVPQSSKNVAEPSSTQGSVFDQYKEVMKSLRQLMEEAGNDFQKEDYRSAIEIFKKIEERVPREVAKFEKPLANIQGVTWKNTVTKKEESVTGKQLLDKLKEIADDAKGNREKAERNIVIGDKNAAAALHNAKVSVFNNLKDRFNDLVPVLNSGQAYKAISELKAIQKELEALNKKPGGDAELVGKTRELNKKILGIIEKLEQGMRKGSREQTDSKNRLARNAAGLQSDAALIAEEAVEARPVQALSMTSPDDNWTRGGIDFNDVNIGVRGDAVNIALPADLQDIDLDHFEGFLPVIVSIVPYSTLPNLAK